MISGLPPAHSYIHPDLQTHLIKRNIPDADLPVQREFVLPLALGERWTLRRFSELFDALPQRDVMVVNAAGGRRGGGYEHHDQKRVLLGLRASEGSGGDGTVVYYIMQEGEVKPRQNG
jgi:tRNA-splicing endonuclease subunit Sen15, fungi type